MLKALERPGGKDPVISAGAALVLFRQDAKLSSIDTKDKARALLRRLDFRSAVTEPNNSSKATVQARRKSPQEANEIRS